jgi:hypothetical protein
MLFRLCPSICLLLTLASCTTPAQKPPTSRATTEVAVREVDIEATDHIGAPPAVVTASPAAGPATQPAPQPATQPTEVPQPAFSDSDPRDTVAYLASDGLEGRGVGTTGLLRAGDFIAGEFAYDGLQPLPGMTGYFQPLPFNSATLPLKENSLRLGKTDLVAGTDFVPMHFSSNGPFSAPVVFLGYGVSDPTAGYDDYADIDVTGKVVLVMRHEPIDTRGRSRLIGPHDDPGWSKNAIFQTKIDTAKAHHAAAVLFVDTPDIEGPDRVMPFGGSAPRQSLGILAAQITRAQADLFLKSAGAPDLKTLSQNIDATFKPSSIILKDSAQGKFVIDRQTVTVRNVVGMIPGSGPHADEYVIVGAHYDHLGKGGPGYAFGGEVGSIFHGADDNASGTAAVLELAARYARQKTAPPRTLIFMTFSAEEEGLIGSEYFVKNPPIPLQKVVAMLNLDMVGRMSNQMLFIGGQGTAKDFDAIIADAQVHSRLKTKSMGRGGLGPSDHMSFALKHVPVIFLFSGLHADYHRPTDVASKINYAGEQDVIDFSSTLIDGMLRMPKDEYIAAADKDSMTLFGSGVPGEGEGRKVILGIIPDFGSSESRVGVLIAGTTPGTPASAVGLQSGDLLVQFGDQKLTNLVDLNDALIHSKVGDKISIKALRGDKTLTFNVTLAARKSS